MSQNILITGSNRGIGLELVRQYLKKESIAHIFATCRNPANAAELQQLTQTSDRLHVVQLDVMNPDTLTTSFETISQISDHLDVMINNAGIYIKEPAASNFGQLDHDTILSNIEVNAVAPLVVTQRYVELLRGGETPRLVMMSSQMGSMQRATGGAYGYRMSKAAMNMAARILSADLQAQKIITIAMHPGWVQTDMGGSHAAITPEESVRGIIGVIDRLTIADNGTFVQWNGEVLPW